MTATATNSTEINASAGVPPEKTVDMATGEGVGVEKPANDNGSNGTTGTGASPEKDKAAADAAAPPPVPAEPSKLDKARAVARAKHEENQRRIFQQGEQARVRAQQQAVNQAYQAERARREAAEKALADINTPEGALAYLEKVGMNPKVLAERAVAMNTPEGRLRAEIEAKIQAATEQVRKEYDTRIAKYEEQVQSSSRQAAIAQAEQRFIQEGTDTETFPAVAHLLSQGDEWRASILEEGKRIITEAARRTGQDYTNAEVLAYLDRKYSKILSLPQKSGESSSNANGNAQNGTGANATGTAGSPRTLTNTNTQGKASLPPDFDSLSPSEQQAALAALYRALRRT